jgi:outer membrane receptor protein involved in Fe transport
VPNQITQRQNQYMGIKGGVRAELGVFVQDRWTINRLTVNAGLRYDYNHTGWDEYTFGPGPLVPNRNFTIPETDFYKFHDIMPRVGAAYDVFGTGRTALKVNIGKYGMALDPTSGVPARDRIVGRVTR